MFKPHNAVCTQCSKFALVVVKKGLCAKCNYELKQNKKKAEGKSIKKKTYVRKKTGELECFKLIWEKRPHFCEVCKSSIKYARPTNFAHILAKSTYPSLRLAEENIAILCEGCHYKFDFGDSSSADFDALKLKRETLKQNYYKFVTKQ